jgi:hypothetical protein
LEEPTDLVVVGRFVALERASGALGAGYSQWQLPRY